MADELNSPNHRWYEQRNNIALPPEDYSRHYIYDSGIQKIDAWINGGDPAPTFSPSTLFSTTAIGIWLDPSDLTTMFSDRAGTTPVTAPGTVVGLRLDKSKGLVLGAEYVTNAADREFSSSTGFWSHEGGGSISGGVANINNVSGTAAIYRFNFPNTAGGYVEISFDLVLIAGAVNVLYGSTSSQNFTTSGRVTVRMYRSAVGTFGIRAAGGGTALGTIDNISVRELAGNHAVAPTDAARPIYGVEPKGGRRNLLTWSEDFGNAAWDKISTPVTVTSNASAAPDGTMTADKISATSANTAHRVFNYVGLPYTSGFTYSFSFYAKASEQSWVYVDAFMNGNAFTWFNLSGSGSVGTNAAGSTPAIVSVGNGWYRCSVSRTATASNAGGLYLGAGGTASDNTLTFAGNGTDGIFLWGAQLERIA